MNKNTQLIFCLFDIFIYLYIYFFKFYCSVYALSSFNHIISPLDTSLCEHGLISIKINLLATGNLNFAWLSHLARLASAISKWLCSHQLETVSPINVLIL